MEEVWKPIPGYEGIYQASSFGQIMRADGYHKVPRKLKQSVDDKGYCNVSLSACGKQRSFKVHTLVASAFLGTKPDGMEVNHIDGNKENNYPGNLEYVTHLENMQHANHVIDVMAPTRARGEKNGSKTKPERLCRGDSHKSSKLTEALVRQVLQMLSEGVLLQKEIAALVNISETQVWRIKNKLSWAHVSI